MINRIIRYEGKTKRLFRMGSDFLEFKKRLLERKTSSFEDSIYLLLTFVYFLYFPQLSEKQHFSTLQYNRLAIIFFLYSDMKYMSVLKCTILSPERKSQK